MQDENAMWSNDYPEPSEQSEKDAKERPMWQGSDNAFKGEVSPSQVYICMCVFRMLYTVFWSYSPLPPAPLLSIPTSDLPNFVSSSSFLFYTHEAQFVLPKYS